LTPLEPGEKTTFFRQFKLNLKKYVLFLKTLAKNVNQTAVLAGFLAVHVV